MKCCVVNLVLISLMVSSPPPCGAWPASPAPPSRQALLVAGPSSLGRPNSQPENQCQRRDCFVAGGGAVAIAAALTVAATSLVILPQPSVAAAPLDAGEAIRRSAAGLPGYGPPDVYYPESFAGTWRLTREVELPGRTAPLRLEYAHRFVRSVQDGAVVADRGANQAELERALGRAVGGADGGGGSGDDTTTTMASSVRSVEWVPNNPNDLRIVLADGTRKEIKVTKRATERTEDTVSSSEFQRVTQEDERGIPTVFARRVVSKWKAVDGSTLEGLEIVYNMGGGDPLGGSSVVGNNPSVLSKSRLYLVRQ